MEKGIENIVIGSIFTLGLIFAVTINSGNSSIAFAQTNVAENALISSAARNGNSITGGSPSTAPMNTFSVKGVISSIFVRQKPSSVSLNPS